MIEKKGQPITGSRPEMRPRPPVLTNSQQSSAQAERIIQRPPMPFENPYGPANVPAPVNRNASHPYGQPARNLHGGSAGASRSVTDCSIHNGTSLTDAEYAAIGEKPPSRKGQNSIISGFPTRGKKGR